jgi:hypothetical protein
MVPAALIERERFNLRFVENRAVGAVLGGWPAIRKLPRKLSSVRIGDHPEVNDEMGVFALSMVKISNKPISGPE